MKRKLFVFPGLALAVVGVFLLAGLSGRAAEASAAVAFGSCPEIPVQNIEGCLSQDGDCLVIQTVNGRQFAVVGNLQGVGAGFRVRVDGNIVPDTDCGCAIVVSSITELGECT